MKTNVVLKSEDREVFGIKIKQETKTGFMSVSDLQRAYEVARWEHGWSSLNVPVLMQSKKFLERIYYILKHRDLVKVSILSFTEEATKQGITKYLKALNLWKTTGKAENRSVMCDPYVWITIALELNPMLYAKVVMFLTDSLLFDRIEAGDEFRPMNNAIKSIIEKPEYPKFAIAINKKVFGKHMTGIRNLASAKELQQITKIEQFIKEVIEHGYIKTETEIIKAIENYGQQRGI